MKMRIRNKALFSDAETVLERENRQISLEAAREGIVLLENDGTLPLQPGRIALYGAGAALTIKGGTGSGEVNDRHNITILEGLEDAGFTVTTRDWLEDYMEEYRKGEEAYGAAFRRNLLKLDAVNIMGHPYQYPFGRPVTRQDVDKSETDTCIWVIARQAGEGADRKLKEQEYSLSDEERNNLIFCAEHYEKLILVINVGSVFDMSFLDEIPGISGAFYFAQQGMMGGRALAELLTGQVTPSGKTVDTWPERYEDIPFSGEYSYLNGDLEEEYYREGIYVGYRYFDTFRVKPRYPFGYGKSYTSFSIQECGTRTEGSRISLLAKVTNTGQACGGREVVQLYVSCSMGGLDKPYQQLAAFEKTGNLKPGESETVSLSFDLRELASFREEDASFVLEPGEYILRLGNSSRDTEAVAAVVLDQEAVTEICEHICPPVREIQVLESSAHQEGKARYEGLPRIPVKASEIQKRVHTYEEPEIYSDSVTDEILEKLSAEDLCSLAAGTGMAAQGRKFFETPGAAGFTTGEFLEKGLPNVCLADGPAGLRIQKTSAVTRSGKLKPVEPNISVMKYFPEFIKKRMLGNSEKQPCVYQFATSFPTGLALAQSWNTRLLERVGEAVGREMEAYGVTYWLAPGMNIHRNPLCGRNFEYYSEDPLLTGKMAAAVSRGVQSRKGCFVTIKHFCCNNQEDNRNRTNANVTERALREIYLRGFEIALREGNAQALMSSYNKVNGEYVNNSRDLLTRVLRCEWGFEGLVMTDWYATGGKLGDHCGAIQAGTDLIMPGGRKVVRELARQVRSGRLEEKALRRSGARVIRGVSGSRIYQAYRKKYGTKKEA